MKTFKCVASSLAVLSLFASCATEKGPEPISGKALFDSFTYQGNDDFYKENPLPNASSFYNPVVAGWASDPSVCTNGKGDYFLVTSTFCYFPGVPIYHSRDLVNWRLANYVLTRESQLVNFKGNGISRGIFAPAISYNPANETYYMVTTNVCAGNFYVKTKDPLGGNWSDPIMLPEVGGIDPSFFFDEDGKAYVVNNDDAPDYKPEYPGHRTIRVQEFDWKNDCTVGPRKILVNKGVHPDEKPIWIEGPHLYKINGHYYLMDAEGGTSVNHSEVIFRSDSPMGPFTPWEKNPILTQRHLDPARPNPVTCAGHADLIQTPEGDWWAFFLACRPYDQNDNENLGREGFLLPVRWTEDGWPVMTEGNETVSLICERQGVQRADTVTFGNFAENDDFAASKLDLAWYRIRTAGDSIIRLDVRPGSLALSCDTTTAAQMGTPAFVGRPLKHHKFEAQTAMCFKPQAEGETAGMILFKDEKRHYVFGTSMVDGQNVIGIWQHQDGERKALASQPFDGANVQLKIVSNAATFDFYYSTDDAHLYELAKGVDASFLTTHNAGGFTGTLIGLYAVRQ